MRRRVRDILWSNRRCGAHTVQYSARVQCAGVELQPSVVRQEDLWSALPLPLNHLTGDSASQQVFRLHRMKNACLYVTPGLRPSAEGAIFSGRAQIQTDANKTVCSSFLPYFYFFLFFFCTFDAWKIKAVVRYSRAL